MLGRREGYRSKYQPLADYLALQPADTVRLTFAKLEEILGFPLPASAYRQHTFWTGSSPALARMLATAGWRALLRTRQRGVVFIRDGQEE